MATFIGEVVAWVQATSISCLIIHLFVNSCQFSFIVATSAEQGPDETVLSSSLGRDVSSMRIPSFSDSEKSIESASRYNLNSGNVDVVIASGEVGTQAPDLQEKVAVEIFANGDVDSYVNDDSMIVDKELKDDNSVALRDDHNMIDSFLTHRSTSSILRVDEDHLANSDYRLLESPGSDEIDINNNGTSDIETSDKNSKHNFEKVCKKLSNEYADLLRKKHVVFEDLKRVARLLHAHAKRRLAEAQETTVNCALPGISSATVIAQIKKFATGEWMLEVASGKICADDVGKKILESKVESVAGSGSHSGGNKKGGHEGTAKAKKERFLFEVAELVIDGGGSISNVDSELTEYHALWTQDDESILSKFVNEPAALSAAEKQSKHDPNLIPSGSSHIVEGDIMVDDDELALTSKTSNNSSAMLQSCRKNKHAAYCLWPNNIWVYCMDPQMDAWPKRSFEKALQILKKGFGNCLTFRKIEIDPNDHSKCSESVSVLVRTPTDSGCSAHGGPPMHGIRHYINLQAAVITGKTATGCLTVGKVLHEILHSLGIGHEQKRPDRDNFLTIHKQNVPSDLWSEYEIDQNAGTDLPYDYKSIMQYGYNFFGDLDPKTGVSKPTMTTIGDDPTTYAESKNILGQSEGLDGYDWLQLKKAYGCPHHPNPSCPMECQEAYCKSGDGSNHGRKVEYIHSAQTNYCTSFCMKDHTGTAYCGVGIDYRKHGNYDCSACSEKCNEAQCTCHNGWTTSHDWQIGGRKTKQGLSYGLCGFHCSPQFEHATSVGTPRHARYCGKGAAHIAAGSIDCHQCSSCDVHSCTCASGEESVTGKANGGSPVVGKPDANGHGLCTQWCSQPYSGRRYCGWGNDYQVGDSRDCRRCRWW